jgi:hypothetical protein
MSLNFPDEPSDGDIFEGYVYNATRNVWDVKLPSDNNIEDLNNVNLTSPENGQALVYNTTSSNWVNQNQTFSGLTDTAFTTPTAGQKLVFDGTNWVNLTGYVYVDTVYFTSNGTFSKADYPWLRAIRVKCQGAGGSGGGALATGSGQASAGSGGGGGGYAESFITDIAGLASSVTIPSGAGGGATTGTGGNAGGVSSFGSQVSASGGGGGSRSPVLPHAVVTAAAGEGGFTSVGDLLIRGGDGGRAVASPVVDGSSGFGGEGGGSFLGGRVRGEQQASNGFTGKIYGGGGSGASNCAGFAARTSGAGANGIVIVELYA